MAVWLLVPDQHWEKVLRFVNETDMRGRLQLHHVRAKFLSEHTPAEDEARLFAIDIADTNESLRDQAALLAAFGISAQAQDAITIGNLVDFTGDTAVVGREYGQAKLDAIAYINRHGGINGKRIAVETLDYGYIVPRAIAAYKKWTAENTVVAIQGWGTADTEAAEFKNIYKLPVVVVPTNKPTERIDAEDQIYRTEGEKLKVILSDKLNEIEALTRETFRSIRALSDALTSQLQGTPTS